MLKAQTLEPRNTHKKVNEKKGEIKSKAKNYKQKQGKYEKQRMRSW